MKKELLRGQGVQMQLWENSSGDLFILLNTVVNSECLIVQTDAELLMDFFSNHIVMSDLVTYSPSPFAMLIRRGKLVRLYLPDAEVNLRSGNEYFCQLSGARVAQMA